MNVPLQVKKAAQRADEIQQQLLEEQKKADVSGQGAPAPTAPAAEEPPAGAAEQGEAQAPAGADTQFTGAEGAPAGGQEGEEDEGGDYAEKYRTLAGKYSSEVPKLHQQIRDLQNKLDGMRNLIAQMQTAPQPQPPPAPTPDNDMKAAPAKLLSAEEIEEYGDDLIDVMGRAGKAAVTPEILALRKEVEQLRMQLGNVNQHVVKTEREGLFDILGKEVPDWRRINESQEFLNWLAQPDPYSGVVRQEMLDHASVNNDATRIINFFRGFLRESNAVAPPSQTGSRQAKRNLEDMVTPGAGRSGTASAPKGAERNWSQREIASFYRDVRDGKYKNDPKQKDAIERQIMRAVNEGRVTA
jgi:hypothetical protein